jgi:hypothetical protein
LAADQTDGSLGHRVRPGLARWDNRAEIDALLPPADGGVIGYNAALEGFNSEHHRVSIARILQRLAAYSRQPAPPGLALQSALISDCLPGFLVEHALPS